MPSLILNGMKGCCVTFPQDLAIVEYFNFDRFNEVVLATDRQFQPTAVYDPGSTDAADLASLNARSRITLDDGRTSQNMDPALHPNGSIFDLTNLFRGGDLLTGTTGVIDETFGLYRIQPTDWTTWGTSRFYGQQPTYNSLGCGRRNHGSRIKRAQLLHYPGRWGKRYMWAF